MRISEVTPGEYAWANHGVPRGTIPQARKVEVLGVVPNPTVTRTPARLVSIRYEDRVERYLKNPDGTPKRPGGGRPFEKVYVLDAAGERVIDTVTAERLVEARSLYGTWAQYENDRREAEERRTASQVARLERLRAAEKRAADLNHKAVHAGLPGDSFQVSYRDNVLFRGTVEDIETLLDATIARRKGSTTFGG